MINNNGLDLSGGMRKAQKLSIFQEIHSEFPETGRIFSGRAVQSYIVGSSRV